MDFAKKETRTILFAVTLGNLLEWYEIYLYVYWAPIIGSLFFDSQTAVDGLRNAFLAFAIGFLARPLGGVFFGRIGDRIGRKKALILSIVMMTIPTFLTGLLPTYAQIGTLASWSLILLRILQAFPAGGELPGAFCYLFESAQLKDRRFLCSWGGVGFQVGILLSTAECFLLEQFLPREALIEWGWRVSFLFGGCIGLLGFYLRYKLHETPLYKEMVTHERLVRESVLQVLGKYKSQIIKGIAYCAFSSSSFYLLTVNFPLYFEKIIGTSHFNNVILTLAILVVITVPLPFFGYLGDKISNKKLLVFSMTGMILLLFPLYFSLNSASVLIVASLMFIFCILSTSVTALLPYLFCDLFPTHDRFTCVGVSFNLVDAVIGGFSPIIVLFLMQSIGSEILFCWFLLFIGVISLASFLMMREPKRISH